MTVDDDAQTIVLRTSNKKYFKRFPVPSLQRAGIALGSECLDFSHSNNTLVVTYEKPQAVKEEELQWRTGLRAKSVAQGTGGGPRDGDIDCKQM